MYLDAAFTEKSRNNRMIRPLSRAQIYDFNNFPIPVKAESLTVDNGEILIKVILTKLHLEMATVRAPFDGRVISLITHEKDNIMSVFATVGSGPGGNGQNVARMFIRLKDCRVRSSLSYQDDRVLPLFVVS